MEEVSSCWCLSSLPSETLCNCVVFLGDNEVIFISAEFSWVYPSWRRRKTGQTLPFLLLASKSNLHIECVVCGKASLPLIPPWCCQWLSTSLGSRALFFPGNLYFPTSIVILMPLIIWGRGGNAFSKSFGT